MTATKTAPTLAVRDVVCGADDSPALEGLLSVVRGDYRRVEGNA